MLQIIFTIFDTSNDYTNIASVKNGADVSCLLSYGSISTVLRKAVLGCMWFFFFLFVEKERIYLYL